MSDMTIIQQVDKALAFAETRAQVIALVEESASITVITNPAGYQQCHAARMALKNTRIAIQKTGKDARDDAVKFQKAVIAKEKELTDLIEPEEKRLESIQKAVDDAKAIAKAAEEDAKRKAQEAERARFDALKMLPMSAVGASVEEMRGLIETAEGMDGQFPDATFTAAFKFERGIVIASLKAAIDRQMAADEEAVRVLAEREELAKLRAEQDAVRLERERLEWMEAQRLAKVEADRIEAEAFERARVEAIARTERERLAKIEADRKAEEDRAERRRQQAIAETERVRQQAAREAREAEQARIDAERAETRKREDADRAKAAAKLAAEQAKAAAERAKLVADMKAAAKAARESEIASADLFTAAHDAVALLQSLGYADNIITLKLESACKRDQRKAA